MELLEFNQTKVSIKVPKEPYRVLYEENCPMIQEKVHVVSTNKSVAPVAPTFKTPCMVL